MKTKQQKCPATVGFTRDGRAKLIYCGKWTCKHCASHLAKRWAVRAKLHIIEQGGEEHTQFWFITLTLPSKYRSAAKAFSALPKLWNRLRMSMKRTYVKWQYMAFVEGQPQRGGMPHFHIVANVPPNIKPNKKGRVTKRMQHDWAYRKGWGFMIDVQRVNSNIAASYVAKYSTKQHPVTPKNFRRVRVSQDWAKLPRDPSRKLIVPARGEDVAHFIARYADITGLPPEQCYQIYQRANELLKLTQDAQLDSDT